MEFIKQPYLQMPSTDGITVMWETSEESTSEVVVYLTLRRHMDCIPGMLVGKFTGAPGVMHRVRISGLEPYTDYHYKVMSAAGDGSIESAHIQFRTQGDAGMPITFCVTSETGGYGGFHDHHYANETFSAIGTQRPDFLVFAGDMASNGRDREDWNKFLFSPGAAVLGSTPFYLCQGNHEDNTPLLPELFDFPAPCNYYSFDYGPAHFIVLYSTTMFKYHEKEDGTWDAFETDEFDENSGQMKFLKADLESSKAEWKFVVYHYPPFVSGLFEVQRLRRLCPLFEAHGVDIVFSSHTIVYERSHPIRQGKPDYDGGVTYVVAGGAGAMPEWLLHKKQWHAAKSAARPHFVQVCIAAHRLELEAINLNGAVFDRFVIDKSISAPH